MNKLIAVTGASRGIGEQIARVLHRDGATVVGLDVPQAASELQALMKELNGDHLTLDIHDGEIVTLLGPSGCGKTTTLRIVAGLEIADAGTVHSLLRAAELARDVVAAAAGFHPRDIRDTRSCAHCAEYQFLWQTKVDTRSPFCPRIAIEQAVFCPKRQCD